MKFKENLIIRKGELLIEIDLDKFRSSENDLKLKQKLLKYTCFSYIEVYYPKQQRK